MQAANDADPGAISRVAWKPLLGILLVAVVLLATVYGLYALFSKYQYGSVPANPFFRPKETESTRSPWVVTTTRPASQGPPLSERPRFRIEEADKGIAGLTGTVPTNITRYKLNNFYYRAGLDNLTNRYLNSSREVNTCANESYYACSNGMPVFISEEGVIFAVLSQTTKVYQVVWPQETFEQAQNAPSLTITNSSFPQLQAQTNEGLYKTGKIVDLNNAIKF